MTGAGSIRALAERLSAQGFSVTSGGEYRPGTDDRDDAGARPVRVLVCGSRAWTDTAAIERRLALLPHSATVLHGAALGADTHADHAARRLGLSVRRFPADWSRGRRAGPERNLRMLDHRPDLVIAFQRDGSRGTQHTIDEARRRGIPVEVYRDHGHGASDAR